MVLSWAVALADASPSWSTCVAPDGDWPLLVTEGGTFRFRDPVRPGGIPDLVTGPDGWLLDGRPVTSLAGLGRVVVWDGGGTKLLDALSESQVEVFVPMAGADADQLEQSATWPGCAPTLSTAGCDGFSVARAERKVRRQCGDEVGREFEHAVRALQVGAGRYAVRSVGRAPPSPATTRPGGEFTVVDGTYLPSWHSLRSFAYPDLAELLYPVPSVQVWCKVRVWADEAGRTLHAEGSECPPVFARAAAHDVSKIRWDERFPTERVVRVMYKNY